MVVTLLWGGCSLASRRWLVRGRRAVWGEEQVFSFCTDNRWQMAGKLESFQTEEIFRGLCRWCLRSSRTLDSLAIIGRTWPFNRNQYSLNVSELNQQRESSLVNADSSSISSNPVKETVSVTEKCVLRCASCGQRCSSEEAVRIHPREKHRLPEKCSDVQNDEGVSSFISALKNTFDLWPEDDPPHRCHPWEPCRNLKCRVKAEIENQEYAAAGECDDCGENVNDCECGSWSSWGQAVLVALLLYICVALLLSL